jgi:glycosyltransferase involved in cell wall biosynthesis
MKLPVRVAWFPKAEELAGNPYWPLLQRELEELGIAFETSHAGGWLSHRWLWGNRSQVKALHFHFIQPHYAGMGGRVSLLRLCKFIWYLALARLLAYHIVWTMHDLMPTWPMPPRWMERVGRFAIAWLAHDVIVHCEEASRLLVQEFRRVRSTWVFPIPSYLDCYPHNMSRAQARARLDINPECFVICFVGGIRPNKGIEQLLEAFGRFTDLDAILVIAGRPWPPESYVAEIEGTSSRDPRVVLRPERLPDNELQIYIKSANVVVFPFHRVLTSSSVVLAMSFGRPVIVPNLGCLPEIVGDETGIVYDHDDPEGLLNALRQARESNLDEMGAEAARRVNGVSWRDLAVKTAKVYGLK